MKITRVETFPIRPRWLFVKVETNEGIVGWGEGLGDKAHTVAEAVKSYEPLLFGADPRQIQHLWQAMFRHAFWRGGSTLTAAISGIEMALWDILGKSLNAPIWQLLGGKTRNEIRVYGWIRGNTPNRVKLFAQHALELGLTAVKMCPFTRPVQGVDNFSVIETAYKLVEAARETLGSNIDIALDFHGRLSPAMAVLAEDALRPLRPLFIEEPILPENIDQLLHVKQQFKTPVATGERLFTKWGFREIVAKGAADVLQPDPCICGGIFETRTIASMAETAYLNIAPHNPYGPLNFAACLQIAACTPNFLIQEYVSMGGRYLKTPFTMNNGYVKAPEEPGLGIEVDEDYVRSRPLAPRPDPGRRFLFSDGSVADW